eukprot:scaffold108454_cov37-Cyclotella_meneghiniana.AAC.2
MNEVIRLFRDNEPYGVKFVIQAAGRRRPIPPRIRVKFSNNEKDLIFDHLEIEPGLRNVDKWNQLGAAIASCTSLRRLCLDPIFTYQQHELHELHLQSQYPQIDRNEANQCMEALYRGLERNCSIEDLIFHLGIYVPTLNLNAVQFKTSLKHFTVTGIIHEDQSFMISTLIENSSLESFNIQCVEGRTLASEYTRVVSACTKVKKLIIFCHYHSAPEYAALASLLSNPRTILSEIHIDGRIDANGFSTIAEGLTNNSTLRTLRVYYSGDWGPMAKALCDASSIEGIHASNHTLQGMRQIYFCDPDDNETIPTLPDMIKTCLELNKNANKEQVIRQKIARYYFTGDFDISPFLGMPVSVLPEVLGLIEGDDIYQQPAIFRMLKYTDLSSAMFLVSSRDVRHAGDEEGSGSPVMSVRRLRISNYVDLIG